MSFPVVQLIFLGNEEDEDCCPREQKIREPQAFQILKFKRRALREWKIWLLIRSMTELGNFEGYIENKDYVGALAILDFGKLENLNPVDKLQWRGYCYSRLGGRTNYNRAREAYLELLSGNFDGYDIPEVTRLFLAIVYVQLGQYADAEEMAFLFDQDSELKSRILLHLAQKTKDETKLAKHRLALSSSKEDILSAAAVEFAFRHRYQEAVDVYRSILIAGNVDDIALYVYTAMALFNMGRHEQSLEALSIYCQTQPNSLFAANLKACNMFHLYNGQVALDVLDALCDGKAKDKHDLLRHNTVVFNNGEKALQFLPGLVDCVPEARLNLAIYYIKQGEIDAAADLIGDMDADSPQSHFVLGILNVERDQTMGDAKALTTACNHFQSMGEASTECDTVAGRQCMAMYFYLMKQFENSNVFLDSIKEHSEDADDFNWNYGISLAASGKFKEVSSSAFL